MQNLPIDKISKQFDILSSSCKSFLLIDCIEPLKTNKTITFQNDIKQDTAERSLKCQKFFNYCKQYIAFFKNRSYQFLFKDYSLGRFVYEFDDKNSLIASNLYWNPCPLNAEFIQEIEKNDLDVMEYIDNITEKERFELNQISLRSPIRFDFIREYTDKNKDYHPQYHMHYQHKDTRAKTVNILSLYSYMLFILENCYPWIYHEEKNEEKIKMLRKLAQESSQGFKTGTRKTDVLGSKIHTLIEYII